MKIVQSNIDLNARHSRVKERVEEERMQLRIGDPPARSTGPQDRLSLSESATANRPQKVKAAMDQHMDFMDQLRIKLVQKTLEQLTGKKMDFFSPWQLAEKLAEAEDAAVELHQDLTTLRDPVQAPAGFSLEYDYYSARIETEDMHFSAQGQVKTADGRTIDIEAELNMSRRFVEEQRLSIRMGDAAAQPKKIDPLVIHFEGNSAQLTQTKFAFDLDSDGQTEQISMVGPGGGFLALDKNQDGIINNGKELFGPQTDDGFEELRQYDEDGNNFIDEGDSVYDKLRIWSHDENGNSRLMALGDKDVGAIYLGSVDTPFELYDNKQNQQGEIAESSIYLKEDGEVGIVQEIDLVV